MKEPDAKRLFGQLLDALGFCHAQGVFHRDLKPENVLLTSDLQVRLSDFGLGVLRESDTLGQLLNTTCGTPTTLPPKFSQKQGTMVERQTFGRLGWCCTLMLAGCLPFDEDDLGDLFRAIAGAE